MAIGIFTQVAASVRKRFSDIFSARSNTTGSLGTATDGSRWDATSGTIQVTSGAATATTTPTAGGAGTTYPMATITLPVQNNVISLADTNEGSSVALWVQSSSDWWMVGIEGVQNTTTNYASAQTYNYAFAQDITYSTSTSFYGVTNYTTGSSTSFGTFPTSWFQGWYRVAPGSFVSGFFRQNGGFNSFSGTAWFASSSWFSSTGYTQTYGPFYQYTVGGAYYTYAAGTTTAYNEFLRIRQSVSSTVSVITSQLISTVSSIKSLKIFTSGNQITARAYSDTNFVTQIGSDLVYTATGATVNTRYGIAVSPSAYNQSAIIGTSIDVSRN